jgi:hypothetical protein
MIEHENAMATLCEIKVEAGIRANAIAQDGLFRPQPVQQYIAPIGFTTDPDLAATHHIPWCQERQRAKDAVGVGGGVYFGRIRQLLGGLLVKGRAAGGFGRFRSFTMFARLRKPDGASDNYRLLEAIRQVMGTDFGIGWTSPKHVLRRPIISAAIDLADFQPGRHELHFAVAAYFRARSDGAEPPYFDVVTLAVGLMADQGHYHGLLLCSPWNYAIYHGS